MQERMNLITMKGDPLTLLGSPVQVGQTAPDFTVVDNHLSPVKLSEFRGKVVVISSVPSLDTGVCDKQTRRFNEEATKLGNKVVILTISMDLPFAQSRWCIAADAKNVNVFSDHRDTSFGRAFGVLIKDLRLLARAVFIADRQGIIRYIEIVDEITHEPDYEAALEAVRKIKK